MNYADIKRFDVANGYGVRVSLFVCGCRKRCLGCFNQAALDFKYGARFTQKEADLILEYLKPDHIQGFSLLGGEPLEPENQAVIYPLLQQIRAAYPNKDIWCYTGLYYDQDLIGRMVPALPYTRKILELIDVLVDGPFETWNYSPSLKFKGSSNQRTIDVPASLVQKKIVLLFE